MYPRCVFHASVSRATSSGRPSGCIFALPSDGRRRPVSIRIAVDFPEPFGPRKPKTLPRGTSNETWSTATNVPNFRVRFSQLRKEDEEEDEGEREEEDFLEGELGGREAGARRAGWSLMRLLPSRGPFLRALRCRCTARM